MIDTIGFTYERLSSKEQKQIVINKNSTKGAMEFFEYKNKVGERKIKHVVKCDLTSSSYKVNFRYDVRANEVYFEFSIPKYIYGTNIYHYPCDAVDIKYELREFLEKFWEDEFELKLDPTRLIINRIDFCFNYQFNNEIKMKAFKKAIFQKMRSLYPKGKIHNYGTETVMYVTGNWSFKVYDKAVEFAKHDYNEIIKSGKSPEEVSKILEDSKRLLRFELTFRKKKLVEVLVKNFRSIVKPEIWIIKKLKLIIFTYNELNSLINYLERNINKFIKTGKEVYMKKAEIRIKKSTNFFMLSMWWKERKHLLDGYIKKKLVVSLDVISDMMPPYFRIFINEYNRLYSSKTIYLEISERERLLNKRSFGCGYELNEIFVKKLLEIFRAEVVKVTKGVTISKTALTEFIEVNRKEIYMELKIQPSALINFIENENIKVTNRTKRNYIEKIEIIKAKYGKNVEYNFDQF